LYIIETTAKWTTTGKNRQGRHISLHNRSQNSEMTFSNKTRFQCKITVQWCSHKNRSGGRSGGRQTIDYMKGKRKLL